MGGLEGKIAVVTGASSGIGRGIAEALARAGAAVVLASVPADAVARAEEELRRAGDAVLGVATDVTDEAQVEHLFDQAVARFGRVDLLVNCAGLLGVGGPIDALDYAVWQQVIAVNLSGAFLCTRAAFRLMKGQGGGRILNIGSISAQRVRPNSAAYAASKHGLWGLTQVTALEGRPYGIVCSCLHPGNTRSERFQEISAGEPAMAVEELAAAALFMAAQPPHVNVLEAIVMPIDQPFLGRA